MKIFHRHGVPHLLILVPLSKLAEALLPWWLGYFCSFMAAQQCFKNFLFILCFFSCRDWLSCTIPLECMCVFIILNDNIICPDRGPINFLFHQKLAKICIQGFSFISDIFVVIEQWLKVFSFSPYCEFVTTLHETASKQQCSASHFTFLRGLCVVYN